MFTVRLRQCRHFFKLITSTQQLLFRSSHFFRAATFLSCYFFRAVTSSQELLFQNGHYFISKILPSCYLLRIGSCLSDFFETTTFLEEEFIQNKDINRRANFLKHSINFFRKVTSSTKVPLQKWFLSRTATIRKKVIF